MIVVPLQRQSVLVPEEKASSVRLLHIQEHEATNTTNNRVSFKFSRAFETVCPILASLNFLAFFRVFVLSYFRDLNLHFMSSHSAVWITRRTA
jgi:hypothetical protein